MNARTFADTVCTLALRCALVAVATLLAACGGGGGDVMQIAKGGIVGTGSVDVISVGAISTLDAGQISVNRTKFATAGAAVRIDGQPASVAALQVGMVVSVQGQTQSDGTANATSVDFRYEVQGIVDGVDNASRVFTLLGQRVQTDALTVFAGGTFDTLLNQYVQVSGFRAAGGDLLATRVEIRPSVTSGASLEITGVVASLDPVAKTFAIGAQGVDYSQIATAFVPPGLANGAIFHVAGTMLASTGRLVATRLDAVAPVAGSDASKVEIEGLVTGFTSLASFRVSGQLVDGHAASISGGAPSMLVNGVKVEIEGTLVQGVIVATAIEIEQTADVSVDGIVEALDATSVTIAGQRVAVTVTTQFEDDSIAALRNFSLSAIRVGDRLSISATQSAGGLVASRIVRLDVTAPSTQGPNGKAEGAISGFVSVANFVVSGYTINASSASFSNGVAGDLANGVQVAVDGVFAGNVLLATRVSFETSSSSNNQVSVEGTIANFVSLGNFQVTNQTIDARNAQFEGGVPTSLGQGVRVRVVGTLSNGTLIATKVTIERAPSPQTLELEGTITAFVSVRNFTVAGHVVDASQAAFSDGAPSDLANGQRVQVTGPVVNGVLQATKVEVQGAPRAQEASVKGTITNFVSVGNFTVAGRMIDASSATFQNGSASQLKNGVQVEIEGTLVGSVLQAKKVNFDD